MLSWSNLQTVMQLVVGLNTIYASFTEIRQPALSRETKAVADLRADVQAYASHASPPCSNALRRANSQLTQLGIDVDTLHRDAARFDTWIRESSIVIAVIYTVLLIISSLFPTDNHLDSFPLAIAIATVGFAPPLVAILVNTEIAHFRVAPLRQRRRTIASELHNAPRQTSTNRNKAADDNN